MKPNLIEIRERHFIPKLYIIFIRDILTTIGYDYKNGSSSENCSKIMTRQPTPRHTISPISQNELASQFFFSYTVAFSTHIRYTNLKTRCSNFTNIHPQYKCKIKLPEWRHVTLLVTATLGLLFLNKNMRRFW